MGTEIKEMVELVNKVVDLVIGEGVSTSSWNVPVDYPEQLIQPLFKQYSTRQGVVKMEGNKYRKCPKCGGSLFTDRDIYGWFQHCINCGLHRELKNIDEFKEELAVES